MICKKNNIEDFWLFILFFTISFLLLGAIIDSMVICKQIPVIIKVENISEFSLALIQIQATIVTLMLSIIGILSGVLSDQYMGVSVSYYFLEIKPYPLTHKKIVYAEFILLGFSLIGYVFLLYNFLFSIFISSLILIVVSIVEMYEVFKGKKYIEDNIKEYINSKFKIIEDTKSKEEKEVKENTEDTEEIKKGIEIAGEFVEHWKSIVSSQTTEEFEQYSVIFWKIFIFLLHNKKIDNINSYTESMALSLLQSESQSCKLRGMLFINDVYQEIKLWIDKHRSRAKTINQRIEFTDRISAVWYSTLCLLDDEVTKVAFEEYFWKKVETYDYKKKKDQEIKFQWFDYFTKTILYVHSYISPFGKQFDTVMNLANRLGDYVIKQKKMGHRLDEDYWSLIIAKGYDYSEYFRKKDENEQNLYIYYLILRDFNICFGYLMNCQTEMILQGLCSGDAIGDLAYYEPQLKKLTLIHCLMYYIVNRGEKHGIPKGIRKKTNQLLLNNEFQHSVTEWYIELNECENLLLKIRAESYVPGILKQYKLLSHNFDLDTNTIGEFFKEIKSKIKT